MVNEAETYVIDMEFAFFGPFGFDIGKIIANFLMCATAHLHRSSDRGYSQHLLEQATEIWTVFERRFLELWAAAGPSAMLIPGLLTPTETKAYQAGFMTAMLRESVGFAACCIARRTLGIAGVADIRDIPDLAVRSRLEIINLQLSLLLMREHASVDSIEQFAEIIAEFYRDQPQIP
jgi:5-methylthioribose kinase